MILPSHYTRVSATTLSEVASPTRHALNHRLNARFDAELSRANLSFDPTSLRPSATLLPNGAGGLDVHLFLLFPEQADGPSVKALTDILLVAAEDMT